MEDPFGTTAPDEAQSAPVVETAPEEEAFAAPPEEAPAPVKKAPAKKAASKPVATATVDVKPVISALVDDSEQVRITWKSGTAYDAPWLTADFPSIDVAHAKLSEAVRQKKLAEVFGISVRASVKFQELLGEAKPASAAQPQQEGSQGGQQRQSAPQAAQEAPGGEKRYCSHGEMRFRSGVSKAGKAYSAFFCGSGDRNNECKAQFLR